MSPQERANSPRRTAPRGLGEPGEGLRGGNCLLGQDNPGQGSSLCPGPPVMLCSPCSQGRKLSSPPEYPWKICFAMLSSFLLNTASLPLPLKFFSLDQRFQCHLFKCHLPSPPSLGVVLPQIISTHFKKTQKPKPKSPSPPHPSL